MSVKIYSGNYLNGMPTFEYSINVNGVSIGLKQKDFIVLQKKLGKKISEDYNKAIEVSNKHFRNVTKIQELRKDIIEIFWEGNLNDPDAIFFRKTADGIDQEKLFSILEKYNRFLGFE